MNNCKEILILICIILQYRNIFSMLPNGIMPFDTNQVKTIFEVSYKEKEAEENYKNKVSKNTEDFYKKLYEIYNKKDNVDNINKNNTFLFSVNFFKNLIGIEQGYNNINCLYLISLNGKILAFQNPLEKNLKFKQFFANVIFKNLSFFNKSNNIPCYKILEQRIDASLVDYFIIILRNALLSNSIFFDRDKLILDCTKYIDKKFMAIFLYKDLKNLKDIYNEFYSKFQDSEIFFNIFGNYAIPYRLRLFNFNELIGIKSIKKEDKIKLLKLINIGANLEEKKYNRPKFVAQEIIKFY